MLYPVYVHMGNDTTAHDVTFPDFEGCFAAADDWAALPTAIQEAVEAHFFGEYSPTPAPTPLEQDR
jgi:predicted RNase H-like HicB family nuclease